jgi:integrase
MSAQPRSALIICVCARCAPTSSSARASLSGQPQLGPGTLLCIQALWERRDIGLREKTLWRLLDESAARAHEVLGLDVTDLDLDGKRVRVTRKGGNTEWIQQTGRARLSYERAEYLFKQATGWTLRQTAPLPAHPPRRGRLVGADAAGAVRP